MKTNARVIGAVLLLTGSALALAQPAAAPTVGVEGNSISMTDIITAMAKKSSKRFVVDPRVRADVTLFRQDPSQLSYTEFLTILQLYGFAAVPDSQYVRIVPDAIVRQMALPLLSGKEKYLDAEYVSSTIVVKSMPAAMLVPVLRPLLPQQAHLAAVTCGNTLILVDTFANVRRIQALIQAVDTGEPYKADKCSNPNPA